MTDTTTTRIFRRNPHANPEGSAFLLTLLERYVDNVPERTRPELQLAREIDARPDGRRTAEEAVRNWRALPMETKVAAIGAAAAAADNSLRMTEEALAARAAQAFRPRGVHDPNGFTARAATIGRTPVGARPFTMPESEAPRPGDTKASTDSITGKTEVSPDPGGAGTLLGRSPATMTLGPDRTPATRTAEKPAAAAPAGAAPIYTVSYVGLYCAEESTWDGGSNSDEPYVNFNMYDDSNHSWAKRTAVYSDVDRKEIRGPNPNPLVVFGPAYLPTERTYISALVTEHDFGNPEKIKQMWHDAATIGQCVAKFYGVDVDQAVVDSAANLLDALFNMGDDIIGWDTGILWPEGFEWYLSFPLNYYKGIWYDFFLFHTDNDSEFYTFYRIDRY
ncbi:hypothetical protein [Phytohabitans rumicis]|uniref:Uncharacterized protein n=1 Tax=Phytohabitans rumicis TaxID=1076125 RepID=A0A6V8LHT1_9ACTN|nr:hypothetical protein [Phytohabitans rumicis]GFJ93686.1 hypothetical protein Prum_073280 [Phytohabitans rumicis]